MQIKHKQNCVQKFSQFFASRIMHQKNLQKFTNVSFIVKNNPDFFQNFPMISLAKKGKKRKW